MYSEGRSVEHMNNHQASQPYYGLQGGRSPSDELDDTLDSGRRESGMGATAFDQRYARNHDNEFDVNRC